jgi:hypothetical protein
MRSVYRVVPNGPRWSIVAGEGETPMGMYDRKTEAVKAAKEMATADLPSVVIVRDTRGNTEAELSFGVDTFEPA